MIESLKRVKRFKAGAGPHHSKPIHYLKLQASRWPETAFAFTMGFHTECRTSSAALIFIAYYVQQQFNTSLSKAHVNPSSYLGMKVCETPRSLPKAQVKIDIHWTLTMMLCSWYSHSNQRQDSHPSARDWAESRWSMWKKNPFTKWHCSLNYRVTS